MLNLVVYFSFFFFSGLTCLMAEDIQCFGLFLFKYCGKTFVLNVNCGSTMVLELLAVTVPLYI